MASAPRPGRKGGKIESPAIAPSSSTARTPPSEIKLAAREQSPATAEAPMIPQTSSEFSSQFLQFDPTAVDLVGKGSVLGGAKHVRMEQRSAAAGKEEIEAKMQLFFAETLGEYRKPHPKDNLVAITTALQENRAVATTLEEGLLLVSEIIGSPASSSTDVANDAVVLVVVPSYFVVEKTAEQLRNHLTGAHQVGTLSGASVSQNITDETRLWVTDAKTALSIVVSEGQNPTTHIVFFKSQVHQPSVQLVLAAIKQSESFSGKVIFAGGSIVNDIPKLAAYLAPLTVGSSPAFSSEPSYDVTSVDLEEVCALVGKDVVSLAVDRTGRYPGPHPKIVENSMALCVALLEKLVRMAKSPQSIVVFTAEVGEVSAEVQKVAALSKLLCTRDELSENIDSAKPVEDHRIFIFSHCDADETLLIHPTIVIDKGTMKTTWLPSHAEVAFPAKRTEWQSKEEQALRKRTLGWASAGVYVSLFPQEAKDVFPTTTSMHLELIDMENALLQVSRAKAVVSPDKILTAFPKEAILRSMQELAESAAIVSSENIGFTFTGEILHRLPTLPEVSNIVLNGLVLGLEEAAIAVAAVSSIHLFPHKVGTITTEKWIEQVAIVRKEHTGGKSATSDVLADAMIVLKWLSASLASPDQAETLATNIGVPLYRLNSIVSLMRHMRAQLTDYAFLNTFNVAADVDRTITSLNQQWDVLLIVLATALCRKSVIVRNEGQINARDISGNMMFLRTAKSANPNAFAPSSVAWKVGNAVVGASVNNSQNHFFIKDVTTLRASYYLTTLILLAPAMDYSPPQQTTGADPVVYLSMSANGQQKRAKVGIEGAARMLEFREKWNTVYGAIMVLRSLPRSTTVSQYSQYLQARDKAFNVKALQRELQEELKAIAEEAQVTEDNRSFLQTSCHRFVPSGEHLDASTQVSSPSDEELIRKYLKRALKATDGATAVTATSAVTTAAATTAANDVEYVNESGVAATPLLIEDDDVEVGESYFAQNGPIDDDDE